MFASPNVRLNLQVAQENGNSLMARKAGASSGITRKPLGDRAVNKKSPNIKTPKQKSAGAVLNKTSNKPILPTEEFHDTFSYKEVKDNYEDIWPMAERLSFRHNILQVFHKSDPEPSINFDEGYFDIDEEILQLPKEPQFGFSKEERDLLNDNFIEVEDVPMPHVNFDNFTF